VTVNWNLAGVTVNWNRMKLVTVNLALSALLEIMRNPQSKLDLGLSYCIRIEYLVYLSIPESLSVAGELQTNLPDLAHFTKCVIVLKWKFSFGRSKRLLQANITRFRPLRFYDCEASQRNPTSLNGFIRITKRIARSFGIPFRIKRFTQWIFAYWAQLGGTLS